MNAKEYLLQISKLDKLIENKQIEVDHWKTIACSTGVYSTDDRVQSSGSKQKMAAAVVRYIDIQKEITADIDRLVHLKQEVISKIEQLPVAEYDILHKIYVQRKTFQETAAELDRSKRWVSSIHGMALQSLQKILDKEGEEQWACLRQEK